MKIIKLTEKSVNKMYGIAEDIAEAAEAFMECLDKVDMGNREEDWDQDEEDWDEDYSEEMETGHRRGKGYRQGSGSSSMGNRGGYGYRSGVTAKRGDISARRGVKGTGRYSRY